MIFRLPFKRRDCFLRILAQPLDLSRAARDDGQNPPTHAVRFAAQPSPWRTPSLSRLDCQAPRFRRAPRPPTKSPDRSRPLSADLLKRSGRWPKRGAFRAPRSTAPLPASPSIPRSSASAESQPEFVRPIWDYVTSAVSPDRIERGRDRARSEALWLARAKDLYGVDDAVILGRLGAGDGLRRFRRVEQHHSIPCQPRLHPLSGRLFP